MPRASPRPLPLDRSAFHLTQACLIYNIIPDLLHRYNILPTLRRVLYQLYRPEGGYSSGGLVFPRLHQATARASLVHHGDWH